MPSISNGQIAVFYATGSLALLWKLVSGPHETASYSTPPNQSFLIVQPGQPYDDLTCYQLIGQATGKAAPTGLTDRCVVVDATNTVVDVQKRDPVILPQQVGETAVISHQFANLGDLWAGGTNFTRRCAIYTVSTGIVAAIQTINVTSSGADPVNLLVGQGVLTSNTLQIGQQAVAAQAA